MTDNTPAAGSGVNRGSPNPLSGAVPSRDGAAASTVAGSAGASVGSSDGLETRPTREAHFTTRGLEAHTTASRVLTAAGERFRDRVPFGIELAATDTRTGARRIRGVANTGNVMRSGRMIHPDAMRDFESRHAGGTMPLLAQHGESGAATFATIGQVDRIKADPQRGLLFEATLAEGVQAADDAWALVKQGMLKTVSIGWTSREARHVSVNDRTIDDVTKQRLTDAGVSEAMVYFALDVVEISLVDVPDDPGAVLIGRDGTLSGRGMVELAADVRSLRTEIAALRQERASLKAEFGELVADLWAQGEDRLIQAVQDGAIFALDPECRRYGEALLDDSFEGCGHGETDGGGQAAGERPGSRPVRCAGQADAGLHRLLPG